MSNPFDQFDSAPPNPFDRFDGTSPPPAGATGEAPKDEAQPGFFSQAASRLGEGMTSEGAALGATAIMHDMAPAASAAVIAHHFANQAAPVDAGRKAYETEGEAARHQLGEDWKSGDYLGAAADVGSVLGTYIRHPKQTALGAIEGLPGMVPMLGGMEGGAAAGSAAGAAATAPFAALSGPAAPVVEAAGTGLGAVAGAFGGGTAAQVPFSYGQWVLQRMAEEGKKRGLDLTKPEDVAALAADPTFNKPVKAEASRFGLTDSAAQTAVAMMGGKLLGLGTRLAMPVVTDAAGKALLDSAGKVVTKPLTKSGIAKIATAGAGDIALQAAGFGVGGEEARAQATGEGFSPERAAIGAASSLGPALVFTAHGAIKGAHGEQAPKGAASQSGEEKPAAAPPSGFTAAQDDDGSWGVKGPDGAWVDSQRFSDPHAAQAAADIHAEGKQGQTVPLLPAPAPQRALPAPDTGLWGGREPGTGFNMKEAPPEGAIPVQGENGQGFILGQTPAAPPVHPDLAQMIAGKAPGDEVSFGDTKRATGLKAKADITQARQDAVDAGLLTLNGDGKTVVAPRHPAPGTEAAPGFDPATGNVAVRADNGQGAVIKDEPNAEAAEADAAALNGGTPAPRRRPLGGNDQWEGFGQPDFTGWGDHPAPGRRLPEASPPVPPPEEGAPPPEPQARTPGEPAAVPMPEPEAPLPAVPPVPGHEAALPPGASPPNAAPAQAGQVAEPTASAAPAPVPPSAESTPSSTSPSLEAATARYHAAPTGWGEVEGGADNLPSREETIAAITRAWDEMGLPRENGLLADRLFGEGESLTNSGAESADRKSVAGVALGRVAALSLEAMDPTATAFHEGFHILEHAGAVRPDEIALMERENEKLRRLVAAHVPGIDAEALTPKEVRAYGFEAYQKAKAEGKPVGMLPRLIREAYDRVALFFSRLGNALRGMGFRTSEDVYRAITEEKRGQRVAAAPEEAQALMDRLNSGEGSFGANYSAGPVDQLPPVITRQSEAHSEARDEVLWRGAEDGNEHNAFVDTNGKTRFETSGEQDFSAFSPETVDRLNDAAESITIHHNHPGGGGLSMTDIVNLAYPGVRAIVAHTHSGESSAAWLTAEGRNLLGRLPAGTVDGYLTKIYQDAWDAAEKVIGRREGGRNTDVREIVNRALDSVGLIHYESGHALDVPKGTADLARNASITAARNTLAGFERRNPRAVEILDQPSAVDRPEAAGGFHRQDEDAGPGRRRREGRDLGSRTRVGASGEASSFPSLEEARDRGRAFQEGTDGLEHRLADLSISLESADGRAVVENGPKGTSGTDDTERAAFAQRLRDFADEVTRSLPEERRRAFSKALVEQYRLDALKATSDKAGLNRLEAPERALAERWMAMAKEAGRHRMTMPDLRAPRRVPPPPAAPPSVETINRHLDDVLKALSPTSRGLLAKATERIFRKNLAERAQKDAMVEDRFQQFRRLVNGLDEEQRWRFLDNIEEGRPQDTPELRQVDAVYRRLEEHFRSQIQSLGTGHLDHFLENYVRHYWQDPRQAEAVEAQMQKQAALAHGRRPQEGSKAWQRQRTIRTYREGMEKGLKPLYSDPLTIMVNQFADLNKFYHAQLLKRQLVESGLVRFERSLRVPAGERAIDDKMFRAMTPITNEIGQRVGGMEIHGQWVAPEPVARLVNNYLSAGLHGRSAIYDSLREAGNTLNMVQLGLSAFHATFASIDTMISRMALGLMQASRGEFGEAGKNVLGAFNPLTVKRSFDRGKALEAAYLHPGTVRGVEAEVARMFVEGGGRKSMDHFWNASATHDFFQSWKNGSLFRDVLETLRGDRDLTYQGAGDIPKLAANIPWTVLTGAARLAARTAQTVSHPLMQALVPRLKMGVFADLAEDYLRSHPNASDVERADFAIKAWDSVENRLGQMTYDNLFWHRVQKDLAFIMIRSVGWNLGTIRELGGGVLDTVRALRDLKAGKPSEMTTRMAYAMAMPLVVGTLGAMMNYAFTGQAPQDWRDYFFPRTGRPIGGEAGNAPERLIIPSYIKDVLEYSSAPLQTLLNKQNPLVSSATELYQNKDYYGGAIYNQDDPAAKRLMEIGEWAFGQYAPFSARGMAHLAGTHTPAGIEALSFFGFQPAPAAIADPERVALIKWQENHRDWQRRQSREAAEAFREKGAEAAVQVLREAGRSQRSIKATMRNLQSPQRRRQQLERAYRRAHPGEDQ